MSETRRSALKSAVTTLKAAGLDTPVLDARLIVQHVLGVDWETLFLGPDQPISIDQSAEIGRALARRAAREPVARIVGRRHFWTLDLIVSAATLDPRADTETVIEAVLAAMQDRTQALRILDLGTGTGALLLALLKEFPQATGLGIDQSEAALEVATANAARHGLGDRATMAVGDWGNGLEDRFDLIVANPPYIARPDFAELPKDVLDYDPISALDGGDDGLDAYRRIMPQLPILLRPTGLAVVEIGAGQAQSVADIAAAAGLQVAGIRKDLARMERVVVLRQKIR